MKALKGKKTVQGCASNLRKEVRAILGLWDFLLSTSLGKDEPHTSPMPALPAFYSNLHK